MLIIVEIFHKVPCNQVFRWRLLLAWRRLTFINMV